MGWAGMVADWVGGDVVHGVGRWLIRKQYAKVSYILSAYSY